MGLCGFFLKVEFIFYIEDSHSQTPYVNYIFTKIGIFPADTVEHGVYSMHAELLRMETTQRDKVVGI